MCYKYHGTLAPLPSGDPSRLSAVPLSTPYLPAGFHSQSCRVAPTPYPVRAWGPRPRTPHLTIPAHRSLFTAHFFQEAQINNQQSKIINRKRGAQPRNTNAVSHGFYARKFKPTELKDLEGSNFNGLYDEIAALRVFTRRLIELGKTAHTLAEVTDLVRVLCLSSTCLTRLVRAQHLIAPAADTIRDDIERALAQVAIDLGFGPDDPSDPYRPPNPPEPFHYSLDEPVHE